MGENLESQGQEPEKKATREEVMAKVMEEIKAKHTDADGNIDVDGLARAFFHKDEKVHYANKEAKERRLKLEAKEKEIAEKEARIKAAEDAELEQQGKYKELADSREAEIKEHETKMKEMSAKIEELTGFKTGIIETTKQEVESLVGKLGSAEKELFDAAAGGFPEDYTRQLTLVKKLTTTTLKKPGPKEPLGQREHGDALDSIEELAELKQRNPQLYKQKLRERALKK
jgi:hypothetical protein